MPRGGAGRGQGRKSLPLFSRAVKHSVTLPMDVDAWVREQQREDESFSGALARLVSEHPRFMPSLQPLASPPAEE